VTSSQLRQLEALGGTIVRTIPQIGVVTVAGDQEFAATAASVDGVRSVSLNRVDRWLPTNQIAVAADFGNPPLSGDDDSLFDLQWGHNAVGAVDAWNEGFRGAGALVAVLDTGFDLDHPDFAGQIVASENFTSQGGDAGYTLPDLFSHGSLVAGIIAAADNGIGVIGVAPEAKLLLGKVVSDEGPGFATDIMAGIVWAADKAPTSSISASEADGPRTVTIDRPHPRSPNSMSPTPAPPHMPTNTGRWSSPLPVMTERTTTTTARYFSDLQICPTCRRSQRWVLGAGDWTRRQTWIFPPSSVQPVTHLQQPRHVADRFQRARRERILSGCRSYQRELHRGRR
jgi:hypothetical protein